MQIALLLMIQTVYHSAVDMYDQFDILHGQMHNILACKFGSKYNVDGYMVKYGSYDSFDIYFHNM